MKSHPCRIHWFLHGSVSTFCQACTMGPSLLLAFAGRANENEKCRKHEKLRNLFSAGRANEFTVFVFLDLFSCFFLCCWKPKKTIGLARSWQALGPFLKI